MRSSPGAVGFSIDSLVDCRESMGEEGVEGTVYVIEDERESVSERSKEGGCCRILRRPADTAPRSYSGIKEDILCVSVYAVSHKNSYRHIPELL